MMKSSQVNALNGTGVGRVSLEVVTKDKNPSPATSQSLLKYCTSNTKGQLLQKPWGGIYSSNYLKHTKN
jgi:hypothetical protein